MKYPFLNSWITLEGSPLTGYQALDCEGRHLLDLDADTADFALQLDGRTDPAALRPAEEAENLLAFLEKNNLIRRSRVRKKERGCLSCTLWIPRITPALRKAARLYHLACKCSLLILAAGLAMLIPRLLYLPPCSDALLWTALLGGILLGILAHEAGHACAAIDFGAPLYEIGLLIDQFQPGAYCAIHINALKERSKRIQVYAAGIEANLLLAGLMLMLASAFPQLGGMLLMAAGSNLALIMGNLLFFTGLDGMAILSELIGVSEAASYASSRAARRMLQRRNPAGGALKMACAILRGVRLFPVVLYMLPVLSLLWEVITCILSVF